MASYKNIKEYNVEEIGFWVESIGLDSASFKENAVDGDMLCSLTKEDLTGDLGLSSLQAKRVQNKIEFTKELSAPRGGGGGGAGDEAAAREAQLQAENKKLKKELEELKSIEAALAAPVHASAPAPVPKAAPPQPSKPNGPGVVGGAARGAARGALKGAIAGAILPGMDAADGAAAGAAVGATRGGLRGILNRRR